MQGHNKNMNLTCIFVQLCEATVLKLWEEFNIKNFLTHASHFQLLHPYS
jgi:hypothetical protein